MNTLIPEQFFFILEQERRQHLTEAERARLLRKHAGTSIGSLSWARPLARPGAVIAAALVGLIRNHGIRSGAFRGEGTTAEA
jgi:hypothetical protein